MAKKKTTRRKASTAMETKPRTKGQIVGEIAEHTELSRADVNAVFDAMSTLIKKDLGRRGPGIFTVPGLMKIKVVRKPAVKARKGVNPFTGEEMMFKAKPAQRREGAAAQETQGNGLTAASAGSSTPSKAAEFTRRPCFCAAEWQASSGVLRTAGSSVQSISNANTNHTHGLEVTMTTALSPRRHVALRNGLFALFASSILLIGAAPAQAGHDVHWRFNVGAGSFNIFGSSDHAVRPRRTVAEIAFQRGYASGREYGFRAGYADAVSGRVSCGTVSPPNGRRSPHFNRGFNTGYAAAYEIGYAQGRRQHHSQRRHGRSW